MGLLELIRGFRGLVRHLGVFFAFRGLGLRVWGFRALGVWDVGFRGLGQSLGVSGGSARGAALGSLL